MTFILELLQVAIGCIMMSQLHAFVTYQPRGVTQEIPASNCYILGTLSVSAYLVVDDNNHHNLTRKFDLPHDAITVGNCSTRKTELVLTPEGNQGNQTKISLILQAETEPEPGSWSLTTLDVILTDGSADPPGKDRIEKRGGAETSERTLQFEGPMNRTYRCNKKQKVRLQSGRTHATLIFSQVVLQPFSDYQPAGQSKDYICPEDRHPRLPPVENADIFVPIVLAVCLSIVLLLLLAGYLVHRKVAGLGYINME